MAAWIVGTPSGDLESFIPVILAVSPLDVQREYTGFGKTVAGESCFRASPKSFRVRSLVQIE